MLQNPLKIGLKWSKIDPWRPPGRGSRIGDPIYTFGLRLGPPFGVHFCCFLIKFPSCFSDGVLEHFLMDFVWILAPFWMTFWSRPKSKTLTTAWEGCIFSSFEVSQNGSRFRDRFFPHLFTKMSLKGGQNGGQNQGKTRSKNGTVFESKKNERKNLS